MGGGEFVWGRGKAFCVLTLKIQSESLDDYDPMVPIELVMKTGSF